MDAPLLSRAVSSGAAFPMGRDGLPCKVSALNPPRKIALGPATASAPEARSFQKSVFFLHVFLFVYKRQLRSVRN